MTFKDYIIHQFFNLGEPAVRGRFLNSLPDNACHRPKIRYKFFGGNAVLLKSYVPYKLEFLDIEIVVA